MIYGSVCSGIEAATVAWSPLGWRCAFMSEIEPFPRAVLAHHYPRVPCHGDFTTIRADEYPDIAVLVGGTPCQSFSVAGLRGGMADARGNLALEYLRLADRLRPRWLVWENVPGMRSSGDGRDLGAFLGGLGELGYGWAYRSLDAQYFGLAQRRERVFVVGYLGDWRRAAAVLFEPPSLRGDSPPSRKAGQDVARPIAAGSSAGSGYRNDADTAHNLIAFGGNDTRGPIDIATARNAHAGPHGRLDFESETFVTHTRTQRDAELDAALRQYVDVVHSLRADGFDASEDGTGRGTPLVPVAFRASSNSGAWETGARTDALRTGTDRTQHLVKARGVRRLTPLEAERLQGFPDNYTLVPYRKKLAADGPRYKALGNSMAVPVMAWIGRRITIIDTA